MNRLKTVIFSVFCATAGVSLYGMDKPTKPYTTCTLGATYSDSYMALCEHKRDIIVDGKVIGYIQYSDYREDHEFERFIEDFRIHHTYSNLRGCGIGTLCLEQFLHDAKKDNVTFLSLNAIPRAASLYTRFGFKPTIQDNLYMEKKIT
jgi:GNAT superfamily N-acetyltransferase